MITATITLADPSLIAEIAAANDVHHVEASGTTSVTVRFDDAEVTYAAPVCGDIGEPVREVEFEPLPTTAPVEEPSPIREPERTPA